MRAYEFITEAAPFKPDLQAELQKDWMPSKTDIQPPEFKAKGLTLPKDELGRPIEPGLEQPLVSPEDIIGLGAPSMAQGIAKLAQGGTKLAQKAQPHLLGLDPTRPVVQNKLYSPRIGGSSFPAGSTQSAYNVRGVRRPEEIEDTFRWMYDNLDLWSVDPEKQDQAVVIIRNGLINVPMVADQEINLSATLIELTSL